MTKTRAIIEAGAEFRLPAGFFQGMTLESVSGPAFEITEDGQNVDLGYTFGAGVVVVRRAADGNSDDSAFVLDEPGGNGGGDGRGIATMTVTAGQLTGTYTDGTKWNAGTLPVGPKGDSVKGDKGDPGTAATVTVGAVTTLEPGAQATVTNRGTNNAAVLDFGIPQGAGGTGGSGSGGSLDIEGVQDVVGAMVRAGAGASVAYDDAAGTLTIGVSGGGGLPRLSADSTTIRRFPAPPTTMTTAPAAYRRFVPIEATVLLGLSLKEHYDPVYAAVWDAATQQRIAVSPPVRAPGTGEAYTVPFTAAVTLEAGHPYLIGIYLDLGDVSVAGQLETLSYKGFEVGDTTYWATAGAYPGRALNQANNYAPLFDLIRPAGIQKSVVGPLDPVDFPTVAVVADISKGAGARLAGAGKFYIRTSDGQLYEFVGNPVNG